MDLQIGWNGKHNAAIVEAIKGIMLYSCAKCGSHQRREPEVVNGKLDFYSPANNCFACGGADDPTYLWEYDKRALHILSLNGSRGFVYQVQSFWIEIKMRIRNLILS